MAKYSMVSSRESFDHTMRVIFTYYSSLGEKEDPLVLREKNFHKLLEDLNLKTLISQEPSMIHSRSVINSSVSVSISSEDAIKNFEVLVDSINIPMHFREFLSVMSEVVHSARHKHLTSWEREFSGVQEGKPKGLFELCQKDKIVSELFSYTYDEILAQSSLGLAIKVTQDRSIFDESSFIVLKEVSETLCLIYEEYFRQEFYKKGQSLSSVASVMHKFCLEFQIVPNKLSQTDVFVLLLELSEQTSKCVFEQYLEGNRKNSHHHSHPRFEWDSLPFIEFAKMFILMANLFDERKKHSADEAFYKINNSDSRVSEKTQIKSQHKKEHYEILVQFLEVLAISRGYNRFSKKVRIEKTFFGINLSKIKSNQADKDKFNPNIHRESDRQLKAQRSKQTDQISSQYLLSHHKTTCGQILLSIGPISNLIFKQYSCSISNKESSRDHLMAEERRMTEKQFERFCSEFKLTPVFISKRQIGEIFFRIFSEGHQFEYQNQDTTPLFSLLNKPQSGLRFEQFEKALILTAEIESVCSRFKHEERLIFMVEHLFHSKRFKSLVEKQGENERSKEITKKDQYNIDALIRSRNKSGKAKFPQEKQEFNFYELYESMFRKLTMS